MGAFILRSDEINVQCLLLEAFEIKSLIRCQVEIGNSCTASEIDFWPLAANFSSLF